MLSCIGIGSSTLQKYNRRCTNSNTGICTLVPSTTDLFVLYHCVVSVHELEHSRHFQASFTGGRPISCGNMYAGYTHITSLWQLLICHFVRWAATPKLSLSLIGVVDGRRLHCTPAMDRDVPQCMTFHFHAVRGSVVFKRSPAHRNSFQVRHSTLVNIRNLQSSANLSFAFADRLRTRCYKGLCRGPRFRNPCCERMQRH